MYINVKNHVHGWSYTTLLRQFCGPLESFEVMAFNPLMVQEFPLLHAERWPSSHFLHMPRDRAPAFQGSLFHFREVKPTHLQLEFSGPSFSSESRSNW